MSLVGSDLAGAEVDAQRKRVAAEASLARPQVRESRRTETKVASYGLGCGLPVAFDLLMVLHKWWYQDVGLYVSTGLVAEVYSSLLRGELGNLGLAVALRVAG